MEASLLPHLLCLKDIIARLATATDNDPALASQVAIASRLLDHSIVQQADVPQFKAECYAAIGALLPAAAALVGTTLELAAMCEQADPREFDRFLVQTVDLQRQLLALEMADADKLAGAIAATEGRYRSSINTAVNVQSQLAPKPEKNETARNAREVDEAKLLDFLCQTFPEETKLAIKKCSLVSGGFSKFTLGISLDNCVQLPTEIILRGDANTAFGGASVVHEYGLLQTLYANDVRVPRPLALEKSGSVIGSPFILVERRPSIMIGHQFDPGQPNRVVCADIAAQLAAVHSVPLAAFDAGISGADQRSSEKVMQWLDEGSVKWQQLDIASPTIETALSWLRRNAAINDRAPRTLVHGDYVLNNILTYDDKVSAILDWEFAHIGNPAYDLGYSYFMAKGLASWEEYLAAYARAGATIPDEDQLNYHILLAATRLSIMVSQVSQSFISGADIGLAGAAVVGDNYYEQMIMRVTEALARVL